ncbi:hypothetical protein [Paenibacillus sp. HW567]|uniref:hypothetical protein n=1 Tax=Paenibacillus sp. HW567 TaxID=1034769 RepID=UPI0003626A00|nr:hypothetical protein [Paenibacillus sp. HW567]
MSLTGLSMGLYSPGSFSDRPVPQWLVLELLNDAVWAPNDGLREPWRFIYAEAGSGGFMTGLQDPAPAFLIVAMKEESDSYKRDEDFAAVCCLIQNFQLLAHVRKLGVRRTMKDWMYDREQTYLFGVQDKECIVAVLEMGFVDEPESAYRAASVTEVRLESL